MITQDAVNWALHRIGVLDHPMPPYALRETTGGHTRREFRETGIRSYLPIAIAAQLNGIPLHGNTQLNVLDFGCGVGRQLIPFTKNYPNHKFFGCDIDNRCINYLKNSSIDASFYHNDFSPPLKYESDYFDMTYSISVFSHLSIEDQNKWLTELHRITKSGGYCFVSVAGPSWLNRLIELGKLRLPPNSNTQEFLRSRGFFYIEIPKNSFEWKVSAREVTGSYGAMFMDPAWIKENWPRFGFDVVFMDRAIDHSQDLVVLRVHGD